MLQSFFPPFSKPHQTTKDVLLYLLSLTVITIAWWLLAISLYFGNQYGVYSIRAFSKSIILLPVIFFIVALLGKYIIFPLLKEISKSEIRFLLLTSAAVSILTLILFPLAQPDFSEQRNLQIISTGVKNAQSVGTVVEIRKLSYLDGSPVPMNEFELSGDWQIVGETLISIGRQSNSVAELKSRMPGGVVLQFRFNENAGQVAIVWDEEPTEFDLFAPKSISAERVISDGSSTIANTLLISLLLVLHFISLFTIFSLVGYIVDARWPSSPIIKVILALLYVGIFALFIDAKFSYMEFSTERIFRDTEWYVKTADEPLDTLDFWAGIRPFTYPLTLKYFGITIENYTEIEQYFDLVQFQYWFSIFAWTTLAVAFSLRMRALWLKPFVFVFVLYFSINLEISIWDSLILSESTSFSLFALLIAAWVAWNATSHKQPSHITQFGYLTLTILFTILYVFSRESNQYFVIFGAIIFVIANFFGKTPKWSRVYYLAYLVLFVGIVFLKNASFNISNLWQIHLFDHLAHRILPNQDALEYFAAAGMPLSESLFGIKDMLGHEFHDYLLNDPEMASVREWINSDGMSTYMMYLLSNPIESLIEPFHHLPTLFSGDNLEYHQPLYAVPTVPLWLKTLTQRFYPRNLMLLFIFIGVALLGVFRYLLDKNQMQSPWIVVAVLLVSLYPLMFIIWHGNPIEVERHAIPIGIQLRLMGWMTLALLLDQLASGELYPWKMSHKSQQVLEK